MKLERNTFQSRSCSWKNGIWTGLELHAYASGFIDFRKFFWAHRSNFIFFTRTPEILGKSVFFWESKLFILKRITWRTRISWAFRSCLRKIYNRLLWLWSKNPKWYFNWIILLSFWLVYNNSLVSGWNLGSVWRSHELL